MNMKLGDSVIVKQGVKEPDLEVIDKTNADFQLIEDYRIWFANK